MEQSPAPSPAAKPAASTAPQGAATAAATAPDVKAAAATKTRTAYQWKESEVVLNNGVVMPTVGLGTYEMSRKDCRAAVRIALKTGYRMIDTAAIYHNEEDVAKGIADSKIPRSDIFITSKLSPYDMGSEDDAYNAALASLKRLNTDYFDLYLIHWPARAGVKTGKDGKQSSPSGSSSAASKDGKGRGKGGAAAANKKTIASAPKPNPAGVHGEARQQSWRALERLYREGRARAIGVSNYEIKHLEQLFTYATVIPVVNQIEFHPLLYKTQRPIQ